MTKPRTRLCGRLHSTGVASYGEDLAELHATAKRRLAHGYLSTPPCHDYRN